MNTPEQFGRSSKPEVIETEEEQIKKLEAAAEAARVAGVYDHSETEGK